MQRYKTFVKRFIWLYVGANIAIAIMMAMFIPDVFDKLLTGQEVTVNDIVK
jgi:hypothetical protein